MWVQLESGRSAHAWRPGDYELSLSRTLCSLGRALEKIPNARGNGGRSGPGGRRKYSGLKGTGNESKRGRVIYTGSPTVVASLFRLFLHRLLLFVPISVSLALSLFLFLSLPRSPRTAVLSFSPFKQPPVVFHLAGAPLEPTNHHRIPYSEQERSRQCCGRNKKDPPLLTACQNKTAL